MGTLSPRGLLMCELGLWQGHTHPAAANNNRFLVAFCLAAGESSGCCHVRKSGIDDSTAHLHRELEEALVGVVDLGTG